MGVYKVEKVYSYIVAHDLGFSPNPFWGECTLACCKPRIRRSIGKQWPSSAGTWVVGISPKSRGNELVYIMRVDNWLEFPDYYASYPKKRPDFVKGHAYKFGDNIYKPIDGGGYEQLRSRHSKDFREPTWSENNELKARDLSGNYVLLSKNFIYYGKKTVKLEGPLRELIIGRGHKKNFSQDALKALEAYINEHSHDFQKGRVVAAPESWRST